MDQLQYCASYLVHAVLFSASTVEQPVQSEWGETLGAGPCKHSSLVPCGCYRARTTALELRLATEPLRDRPECCNAIIAWMHIHGCDARLMKAALEARASAKDRQTDAFQQIGQKVGLVG